MFISHMTLYNTAKKIVQRFIDHGHTAYFAGGWVRDFLMKHPSNDIDIVTSATVEETIKIFPKTIPVGINFGIVVVVEDGHHFEVAMFRKEEGFKDGRRPDKVVYANPKEDALRRDFTINGMFYDPIKEEIFDYVGGRLDLEKEVVRAIGDPHERFLEDRLRMIRAVRYASRFRFAIDPKTIAAILFHSGELFPAVAMERVTSELEKMAKIKHFDEALVMLYQLNLLQVIFPELAELEEDEIEERVKLISLFPENTPLIAKLLELFPGATIDQKLQLVDYLKLPGKDKKFLVEFSAWGECESLDNYGFAKLFAMPNSAMCLKIIALKAEDGEFEKRIQKRMNSLKPAIQRLRDKNPVVKAKDLLERGYKPGKKFGELLQEAEKISINYSLQDPIEVLKIIIN
jgi:poly(A) polymerase